MLYHYTCTIKTSPVTRTVAAKRDIGVASTALNACTIRTWLVIVAVHKTDVVYPRWKQSSILLVQLSTIILQFSPAYPG